ncbi:MAG: HIT family protein [Candidatus Nanoarchaeia archaeon]|nr:HIT family protein [Candidatus Nanoarchaeia archaeon]
MTDCIFCKIIKNEIPSNKIYENKTTLAFLDINPVNKGHTIVIPKQHFETIEGTPEDVLCEIIKTTKKLIPAINQAVNPIGVNLGLNNKSGAGQIVPHIHLHIMPRFNNDGHSLFGGKKASSEELKLLSDKIKNLL